MSFHDLVSGVQQDTLDSLALFRPELALCGTIVALLFVRMLPLKGGVRRLTPFFVALIGSLVAVYFAVAAHGLGLEGPTIQRRELFTGMLAYDSLTVFFRSILTGFAALFCIFTFLSGIPDQEDGPDFYSLVLGATVGMCVMASANHLLMAFMGVEMASVPSYVLAGLLKGRRKSGEAALKYAVYGAGAAGVMLYGISLLAGALGTVHIPSIALRLAEMPAADFAERHTVLTMGGLFVMVGLAFKLSAVPFHFWCPDVFEGACAEVNAFLSVASKAAALALLVRLGVGMADLPSAVSLETPRNSMLVRLGVGLADLPATAPAAESAAANAPGVLSLASSAAEAEHATSVDAQPVDSPPARHGVGADRAANVRDFAAGLIGLLAAVTATFGNLAAYGQTNIKRLLAYSTIAHAGIMMMPVAAAVKLLGADRALAEQALAGVALYIVAYLFMNLGAFAVVAFLRNDMRTEEIADLGGLIRRAPGAVVCFSLILVSLLGLPPLSGFMAKFSAFMPVASAGEVLNSRGMYLLLAVGIFNSVLSLYYYLRVIKVMTIDPEPADRVPVNLSMLSPGWLFVALLTVPVVVLGVWVDPLNRLVQAAAHVLT